MYDALYNQITKSKVIVVKVGSSSLEDEQTMDINHDFLGRFTSSISGLLAADPEKRVIIVTSGAVGAGMCQLRLQKRPTKINELQALSAIGQGRLMHLYSKLFEAHGYEVGQVLLSQNIIDDQSAFENARRTLRTLIEDYNTIPIINENDAVAVEEIKCGDNDSLSAIVAVLIDADLLIVLSDVDGVYTSDPNVDPDATLMPVVEKISDDIGRAGRARGGLGTGGMVTKFEAARKAGANGIPTVLASSKRPGILEDILSGSFVGTVFKPASRLNTRKQWIACGKSKGELVIDDGAVKALLTGKNSLLPSGIVAVKGTFGRGDFVTVLDKNKKIIAQGKTMHSSAELMQIKGKNSSSFDVGVFGRAETIDRYDLVLLD